MANDIIEFAKEKESEDLRNLAKAIELATKRAAKGNHKFVKIHILLSIIVLHTKITQTSGMLLCSMQK